ncbi:MFS transporter, partial [Pseudomonas viridiflava]|uniref:MFS transporter n=1 Tax=Pseudomonas viridiflava TaxID=33069 RepID=UPI000F02013E
SETVFLLLMARLLTGVSVGVIVSAGMASIVDNGGPERRKTSSLVASMSMVLGAGLGPILAGVIAQTSHQPVTLVFSIELLLLLSAFAVAWIQPNKKQNLSGQGRFRIRLPSVPRTN